MAAAQEVEENDDVKSGYRLSLTFAPNPFFRNTQIQKRLNWVNPESRHERNPQPPATMHPCTAAG